jgi:probable rRNA maturation factor
MSRTLSIRNRQRVRRIDTALLRRITLHVLKTQLGVAEFELAIHLVGASEMARVNQTFLDHEGSTDVITFDHSDDGVRPSPGAETPARTAMQGLSKSLGLPKSLRPGRPHSAAASPCLRGELFVCLDDAVKQACEFRTTWQNELIRYVIHGLLHLCGHDDLKPAARRRMKREENRIFSATAKHFPVSRLARSSKSSIVNHQS